MRFLAIPVAALMLAAFDSPQQNVSVEALEAAMKKGDACAAAPSHACVIDMLWDAAASEGVSAMQPYAARLFIETAMMANDQALTDTYIQRTNWRNPAALEGFRIASAVRLKDQATLVHNADRAIAGVRYDWYVLRDLAVGLAATGDADRARKVAALIPHADSDSLTTRNLHQQAQDAISFHNPGPGQYGGAFAQGRASEALATLTPDAFVAAARAQSGLFSLAREDVLQAAARQTDDRAYGHAIATLMIELAELGDLYAYDLARAAAIWARDACDADLFARAEAKLARTDDGDVDMWRARLSGGAREAADIAAMSLGRGSSYVEQALAGYEPIILKGYCPA